MRRIKWGQKWLPRYFYQHIYIPMLYCAVSFLIYLVAVNMLPRSSLVVMARASTSSTCLSLMSCKSVDFRFWGCPFYHWKKCKFEQEDG